MFAVVYFEFACSYTPEIFTECDHCANGSIPIFGGRVGGVVGSPPPKNNFFQFSSFCNVRSKNRILGTTKILGVGAPSQGPLTIFFVFSCPEPDYKDPLENFGGRTPSRALSPVPNYLPIRGIKLPPRLRPRRVWRSLFIDSVYSIFLRRARTRVGQIDETTFAHCRP